MRIRLVISGRDYHAAEAVPGQLTLPEGSTLDAALQAVEAMLPQGAGLPDSCLIAVSGSHLGTRAHHSSPMLQDGDELLVLAPIAGG